MTSVLPRSVASTSRLCSMRARWRSFVPKSSVNRRLSSKAMTRLSPSASFFTPFVPLAALNYGLSFRCAWPASGENRFRLTKATSQRIAIAFLDLYIHDLAKEAFGRIFDVNRLQPGAAPDKLALALAATVEQYLHALTRTGAVEGNLLFTQKILQTGESFAFHFFGKLVFLACGGCAGAGAVFEAIGLREAYLAHESERRFEILFRLAGKTDDEIG